MKHENMDSFCTDVQNRLNGSCRIKPIARHVEGNNLAFIENYIKKNFFFLNNSKHKSF